MSVLDRELATYRSGLPAFLDHAHEFVLIKDTSVVGFFRTKSQALEEGYSKYLDESFLVREILPAEPVHRTSRFVGPSLRPSRT